MPNNEPNAKDRAIFVVKMLLELIENDRIRAEQIEGLTSDEIIALAEAEAQKAVTGSQALKDN